MIQARAGVEDFGPGFRLHDGDDLNKHFGAPQWTTERSIVATSGATVSTARKLPKTLSVVEVAGEDGAGVTLFSAYPGQVRVVENKTDVAITVFAIASTIDGEEGSVGYSLPPGKIEIFFADWLYSWKSFSGGASSSKNAQKGQLLTVLANWGALGTVLAAMEVGSEAWIDYNFATKLKITDPFPTLVQTSLALTSAGMAILWQMAQAETPAAGFNVKNVAKSGLFAALIDAGKISEVSAAIQVPSADFPGNAGPWVEWNTATKIAIDGELGALIASTLGYSLAQMISLWVSAEEDTPALVGRAVTRRQLFYALDSIGEMLSILPEIIIYSPAWVIFAAAEKVSTGDAFGLLVQTTLGYSSTQMNQLWSLAETFDA